MAEKSAATKQLEEKLERAKQYDSNREWARQELKKYSRDQQTYLYDEIHEQRHGED
jgi:hypothetical protein